MLIVKHRRNTRVELRNTPTEFGVEVDIRSQGSRLIIHHDPFVEGEDFEEWLEDYRHQLIILNVKEEGLEERLLTLMGRRKIEDFFFLDQSFPFLMRTARQGELRCAVRVSEYESIETALSLSGSIRWVWVDCFTHFPLQENDAARLKSAGMRLCLVSPELQGRNDPAEILNIRQLLAERNIIADAVCTKRTEDWR